MIRKYDLIVLGGGSGGIASATRAAKNGAKVAVIEYSDLGGTCVNLGCVPKKIMYNASVIAEHTYLACDYGFSTKAGSLDWAELVDRRQIYIKKLRENYAKRFEQLDITYLRGFGAFVDPTTLVVDSCHYTAPHIIIATGSKSIRPQIEGIELAIDSDGFFALHKQPQKVVIIGSGYISVEFAGLLNRLGTETHLIIRKDNPLSHFDESISTALAEIMVNKGIHLHKSCQVRKIMLQDDNKKTVLSHDNTIINNVDSIIYAIGRTPNITTIDFHKANIQLDQHGFIKVDAYQNTSTPGIYAIGDVTHHPALTPVAIAAGRKLIDRIWLSQKNACIDYDLIPSVVFSHPPIGCIGMTEKQAIAHYGKKDIKIYQTQFHPMFYALSKTKTPTIMKLITQGKNEKIVGLHLLGNAADEMLQGFAVAIKMGACKNDFDSTIAIHPTSAEELVTMV